MRFGPTGAERTEPAGKVKRNESERTRCCEINNVGKEDGAGIKSQRAAGSKKGNRIEQGRRVMITAAPCCFAWLLFPLA